MKLILPRLQAYSLALLSLSLIFILIVGCAKKITFQNSAVVPAAQGNVKVKKDNNNNYHLKIELENLADPSRLQPARTTYVIWMETDENVTKNIGQINSSTGFLSGKRKASFETVSAVKPTKIYLTAEDDAAIQYPQGVVVLTTKQF
ncbi:MAG: hypothetical protein ACXWCG_11280 [Flavitalea sp.]